MSETDRTCLNSCSEHENGDCTAPDDMFRAYREWGEAINAFEAKLVKGCEHYTENDRCLVANCVYECVERDRYLLTAKEVQRVDEIFHAKLASGCGASIAELREKGVL
ncbi:hypothetical protein FWC31_03420 [Candidatus Saccharibacteria bacterium]|nr:hypothetical protein [Candidatus Saccharibacteria bacterium]